MHEDYYDDKIQLLAENAESNRTLTSLKQISIIAVSQHMEALDMRTLELPTAVLKDLLPHLNIIDLDRIQPSLNIKGISTHSAWVRILQDIKGPHNVGDFHTEEESKREVMETLFQLIFYGIPYGGITKYISNINDARNVNSLLLVMAKHTKHFFLRPSQFLQSLTNEQRPLLSILEKSVRCVDVKKPTAYLFTREPRYTLYTLHRIMDHGEAKELIINHPDSALLPWILHGRGSQYAHSQCQIESAHRGKANCVSSDATSTSGEAGGGCRDPVTEAAEDEADHVIPCKRAKFDLIFGDNSGLSKSPCKCLNPEVLCQAFAPSTGPKSESCPQGQIESLQLTKCEHEDLNVLIPFLPTWLCLRSLTLESGCDFYAEDVLALARALKQLCATPTSALTDLSIGVLPHACFIGTLLDACPNLRSLMVETDPVQYRHVDPTIIVQSTCSSELPLERLSVKVPQAVISLDSITSVLKRSPNLTSLHLAGIRLPTWFSVRKLLNTISESNQRLRKLCLEDLNLAICLSDILSLLRNCILEELSLKDCRLLEKCSNSKFFLQQLVNSLKKVPSLQSLNLSKNRLAKNVPVLAELFAGSTPSTVKRLDISSNFIQPASLLEFGRLLEKHRPPQRVTLDLRKNPWDRDQQAWDAALRTLRPMSDFLTDKWKSRGMMADHVSNM